MIVGKKTISKENFSFSKDLKLISRILCKICCVFSGEIGQKKFFRP